MGNVLQSWERHGWTGSLVQRYWLWRDRKSVAGSLLTAAVNLISLYGILRVRSGHGQIWNEWSCAWIFPATMAIFLWRLSSAWWCSARIYGLRFASGRPCGSCTGTPQRHRGGPGDGHLPRAKWRHAPLRWVKTEHEYPSRAAYPSTSGR